MYRHMSIICIRYQYHVSLPCTALGGLSQQEMPMSNEEVDPLDDLVVKSSEVAGENRRLLAELLRPHIQFDPETGAIHFRQPPRLNTRQYVLVYLLAKMALAQKNPQYDPVATARDVEDGTGLPGGSVRPKLTELSRERVISKNDTGYYVAVTNLHKARAILEDTLSPEQPAASNGG